MAPNAVIVSVDHTMYFVLDDQMNLAKLKTFVVLFLLQNFSLDSNNFVAQFTNFLNTPRVFFYLKYLKQSFASLSTISVICTKYFFLTIRS